MAHSTRSGSSFARCLFYTNKSREHFEILQESSKSSKGKAASPPPILQAHLKRLQGVMLISVCQGTFNGAHAFQGTAIQIANFIQMKGACVCRFCFRRLFAFVRFVPCCSFGYAAKGALFPSFAVIVCAWVRLCALARCLRLFICRLRGFYCFCNTLPTLHDFARLVACIAAAFVAASFVLPPFGDSTTRRGKDGRRAGGQAPAASVGAFYSLRSPSASRCSFSATK